MDALESSCFFSKKSWRIIEYKKVAFFQTHLISRCLASAACVVWLGGNISLLLLRGCIPAWDGFPSIVGIIEFRPCEKGLLKIVNKPLGCDISNYASLLPVVTCRF